MFLRLAHTNFDIFEVSKVFTVNCYKITRSFPSDERFVLTQQIRRAALSVHLNIAEGFSRKSGAERKRFFEIARGSLIEVDAAIGIARELGYSKDENLQTLGVEIVRCFQMLSKLIQKLTV